ncbi:MAG: hypothetical protein K1X79_02040 [Oligoflexia bacterium]|nr:hypothetical protein [Oligoflexia bacterium]
MDSKKVIAIIFLSSLICRPASSIACDTCALSQVEATQELGAGEFNISLAQQLTHADRLRMEGKYFASEHKEEIVSSTSTISVGAGLTDDLRLETKLPFLYRYYRQMGMDGVDPHSESGLGDISFLLRSRHHLWKGDDGRVCASLFAGIKLPTGDTDKLRQEEVPSEDMHINSIMLRHGDEEHMLSAVHEHDIALGSGSIDFPIGASVRADWGRLGAGTEAQYTFRNRGDYGYRYGDDLQLSAWLGGTLNTDSATITRLGARLSYDHKNSDRRYGTEEESTASNVVYVGPEFELAHAGKLDLRAGVEFPIVEDAAGLQLVPSTRTRISLAYRF